jgi:hypothetical protein
VPHRRPRNRGSFGSHFDELVVQFRDEPRASPGAKETGRSTRLQEKIDIHAMLFRRAWELDE